MPICTMIKDEFGPEYILKVYDPKIGLEGFLVIDNTVLGPGKGGIRMTSEICEDEVVRLARTMTWKNALAGISFGGAKAGIRWYGGSDAQKKQLIQSFARKIKIFTPQKYIAGPDVNTGAKEMQWFVEATENWKTATGKPENFCMRVFPHWKRICGIPHEYGSTGFGVAQATKVAAEILDIDIKKAKVAIHGFGNVGTFTYRFLREIGANIVAIADKSGIIFSEKGFDGKKMEKLIDKKKTVSHYSGEIKKIKEKEFWSLPVDILIPASVTDVINESNSNRIKAKIIVEAANIPMQEETEEKFFKKGILVVPDIVANSGGVIASYSEYRGYHLKKMLQMVERKIKNTANFVLKESLKKNESPRKIAQALARKIINKKINKNSNL